MTNCYIGGNSQHCVAFCAQMRVSNNFAKPPPTTTNVCSSVQHEFQAIILHKSISRATLQPTQVGLLLNKALSFWGHKRGRALIDKPTTFKWAGLYKGNIRCRLFHGKNTFFLNGPLLYQMLFVILRLSMIPPMVNREWNLSLREVYNRWPPHISTASGLSC